MNTAEQAAWHSKCEAVAANATRGCGQSHTVYVNSFSAAIDDLVLALPQAHREKALALAQQWDYASKAERSLDRDLNAKNGLCAHGLDPYNCPVGCGEGDDD